MKKIVFITLSALFIIIGATAQELQVEGDLDVVGTIDANNHRVKNVAEPVEDTDAVNTIAVRNTVREAIVDDGPWEYKIIASTMSNYILRYSEIDGQSQQDGFRNYINVLAADGWILDNIFGSSNTNIDYFIFKRRIEE